MGGRNDGVWLAANGYWGWDHAVGLAADWWDHGVWGRGDGCYGAGGGLGNDGGGLGSDRAVGDLGWARSDSVLLGAVDSGGGPWSVGGDWSSAGWGVLRLSHRADGGVERDDIGGDLTNLARAVSHGGSTRSDGVDRGSVHSAGGRLVVCADGSNKPKGRNN